MSSTDEYRNTNVDWHVMLVLTPMSKRWLPSETLQIMAVIAAALELRDEFLMWRDCTVDANTFRGGSSQRYLLPRLSRSQCACIDIGPVCVRKRKLLLSLRERSNVYSMCFHRCVCVCRTAERSPWLQLKESLGGGTLPSKLSASSSHTLQNHPGLAASVTQGQSSPVVAVLFRQVSEAKESIEYINSVCVLWDTSVWGCVNSQQPTKTGRVEGNEHHLRHQVCTLINPWPSLLFSFTLICTNVATVYLKKSDMDMTS